MRKSFVFVLIFFLVFILYFKLGSSSATECRCGYVDGECDYNCEQYISGETTEAIQETGGEAINLPSAFLTLTFQFFGIVILLIFLVVLLEEVTKSF